MSDSGKLVFFAIIDDRLGQKEGKQDEKVLYSYIDPEEIEFEAMVVIIGHMQTVMGICSQFKASPKFFRTNKTVTFFLSPIPHIYYMLRVKVNDSIEIFYPFIEHLSKLYSVCEIFTYYLKYIRN